MGDFKIVKDFSCMCLFKFTFSLHVFLRDIPVCTFYFALFWGIHRALFICVSKAILKLVS